MYLRSSQICLSTDSLVIKESSSCRNASLSCELDIYLRSSVLLLGDITLQWQTRSFASSCSSYPSPPCFYIPERLDWSPSPTKLSSSMLQGQPFLAVHRQAVSAATTSEHSHGNTVSETEGEPSCPGLSVSTSQHNSHLPPS